MTLNQTLVGLDFTPTYLLFLTILVAYVPFSAISDLVIICTYLPLRCLLSNSYNCWFSEEIISLHHKNACLLILIVKHHHHYLNFVWQYKPYHRKVLPVGLATAPIDFTLLIKLILFPYHCKGLHVIMYLDDILVLTHSSCACKRAQTNLCSFWCILDYRWIFPSLTSISHMNFLFWAFVGIW